MKKVLVASIAVLLLACLAWVVAGVRAVQKNPRTQVERPDPGSGSLFDRIMKPGEKQKKKPEAQLAKMNWPPFAGDPSTAPKVSLVKGLTWSFAISENSGDYEGVVQLQADDGKEFLFSAHVPNVPDPLQKLSGNEEQGSRTGKRDMTGRIAVRREDLQSARAVTQTFIHTEGTDVQRTPGSTSLSFSTDILLELRQKGSAQVRAVRPEDEVGIQDNALSGILAAAQAMAGSQDNTQAELIPWTLRRVGQVGFPVILNGERKMLAALHVTATAEGATAHRWILDDPDFPLRLAVINSSGTSYQVITINVPQGAQEVVPQLEQQITEQGRAETHGIYFDFNSADIRPESASTLKEIATALERHPTWKLSVEGHTDSIGQDAFNLELSRKRAEAIKLELVARFRIAAPRLTTKGWGASKSVESNTTTEGRARNRRVELVRL